jgi:hypothetical protein
MGIPLDGYNSYTTSDGYNSIILDIVNPLGVLANYVVTITSPVLPDYEDEVEDEPTYELSDFLLWVRPMKEYLDEGEDSIFYPMFTVLSELAKERIMWLDKDGENRFSERIWKQLISFYVGHYFELIINAWKDEGNHYSLNPYNKDKDYHYEVALGNEVFEDFKTTAFGKMFWLLWKPYGGMEHWGCNY